MIIPQVPPITPVISSATAMQTNDEKVAIAETCLYSNCRDYKNDCDPQGCAAFAITDTHMQQATDAPPSRTISPNIWNGGSTTFNPLKQPKRNTTENAKQYPHK